MEADPDNFFIVRPLFYPVHVESHRSYTFNPQHPLWGVAEYFRAAVHVGRLYEKPFF